jgi:hypothetical protein
MLCLSRKSQERKCSVCSRLESKMEHSISSLSVDFAAYLRRKIFSQLKSCRII